MTKHTIGKINFNNNPESINVGNKLDASKPMMKIFFWKKFVLCTNNLEKMHNGMIIIIAKSLDRAMVILNDEINYKIGEIGLPFLVYEIKAKEEKIIIHPHYGWSFA